MWYRVLDEIDAEIEEIIEKLRAEIGSHEKKPSELRKNEELLRKRVFIENIDKKREELLKKLVDNYT